MPDIADPLIQGMMAGLRFKEVFQRARQQREELDMRKQALADARAQRERQAQLHELTLRRQGLQDRLAMATSPALEDVTGSGGTRTITAAVPPEMQSPVGLGKTFSMEAPVENPIEYEGRQYAVRGPQERFNEKIQMETALAGAKRKEAQAGWVPFETPRGQKFNLPPQSVGGAQRAFYPPPPRPPAPARPSAPKLAFDDEGNATLVQTTEKGTEVTSLGKIGKSKGTAGGTGSLAAQRFEFSKAEAARKAQQSEEEKIVAKQAALDKEADPYHAMRVQLGEEAANKSLSDKELPQAIAKYKAATQRIQGIEYRKAAIFKGSKPPDKFAEVLKDGESRTAPDGTTWRKEGDILYFVEGPRKKQTEQTSTLDERLAGTPLAAPQAAQVPSAPATTGPKLGDVRTHLGADYRFDGMKWVRQ